MSKQLIFIGGSKGVGKSSLAKAISSELGFLYVNTGECFRKYRPHFDKAFCDELIQTNGGVLIDTHYAASSSKTPFDFHPGIDEANQNRLRMQGNYGGKIILVDASPEVILQRREADGDPRRCLDLTQIQAENTANFHYSQIYASCLGLPRHIFRNEDLSIEEAIAKLGEIIKNE